MICHRCGKKGHYNYDCHTAEHNIDHAAAEAAKKAYWDSRDDGNKDPKRQKVAAAAALPDMQDVEQEVAEVPTTTGDWWNAPGGFH